MGQTVHDERYEDSILQSFPTEYERVQITSYEKRDFELDDIREMLHTMYIDKLSRISTPCRSQAVATPCRRSGTMTVTSSVATARASGTSYKTALSLG